MNKEELREALRKLIEEYIDDKDYAVELISKLDEPKAKFILAEIELKRSKDYSRESKNVIEDIAFYYC
ncbi:hypothetical protein LGL08_21895 [Clostridium estertheticum]|uniref:hypothetical protein n=1 Tax=Clostridium estertheticum TaxID=238834 RepID=UPI001CF4942A|nr:hypothetical protein [Clostridium estertheticum]MCB2309224.1 hypothetical protein [Clostridium estertheticum]MCB2347645.1 hypothetical protein [Clostridium estertheticum]MCB2352180.1 hypothetical protein [Clostridium estertheticum]WAG45276.1 hypothetical protein LL127_17335 [Clostridium estertheticum]